MRRGTVHSLLTLVFVAASTATAQNTSESAERPPVFSTGVIAGAIRFAGGRTEQATSVLLQYQPRSWLSFSTAPGYGHTSFGRTSHAGLTGIPLTAAAMYEMDSLAWSPSFSASLSAALPGGDSTMSLGAESGALDGEISASGSPIDWLNVLLAWSHPLRAQSGNPSARLESAFSLGRTTATLGWSSEMGRPDSGAVLARSIAGAVAITLVGPLTLTADGSHGISGSAPLWTFSIGLGSAFAGISPLNPTSALKRLKQTFGSKVGATSGYSNAPGGMRSCKRTGTC
jgi:hypothetical protein